MPVSFLPVRVVVFASEQLFPALQFLLHAADRYADQLASIHIYCTPDERRSARPARRLRQVMQHWLERRHQLVKIHLTVGEAAPQDVRQALLDWFSANPDSQWLVNVTGGTKPMSAAASELTLSTDLSERRQYLLRTAVRAPSGDRREQIVLPVSGLPAPSGQGGTKVRCVLPRATRNLQSVAAGGEQRLQHRKDRALVAFSSGAVGPWRCLHKKGG